MIRVTLLIILGVAFALSDGSPICTSKQDGDGKVIFPGEGREPWAEVCYSGRAGYIAFYEMPKNQCVDSSGELIDVEEDELCSGTENYRLKGRNSPMTMLIPLMSRFNKYAGKECVRFKCVKGSTRPLWDRPGKCGKTKPDPCPQ